jgi:NAD(P)-dependent dehydrogenase (short-subunit alcohol dehydrogenase family)
MPSDELLTDVFPVLDPGSGPGTAGAPVGNAPELLARVAQAVTLLEEFASDLRRLAQLDEPTRIRLVSAAGQLARPDRYSRKALAKVLARQRILRVRSADQAVLDQTGIRALRKEPVFRTPLPMPAQSLDEPVRDDGGPDDGGWAAAEAAREDGAAAPDAAGETASRVAADPEGARPSASGPRVSKPRFCYVCKSDFHDIHFFYDQMCITCGELNWAKRNATADLRGRVVMITGARVKIGYQAAIKVLRAGAEVVVATRFPVDAARRFAAEAESEQWRHRLHIYGVDLRHTPSVEALCEHLNASLPRLDGLINNACQTVRRPSGWYDHVVLGESPSASELAALPRAFLERNRALVASFAPALSAGSQGHAMAAADSSHAVAANIRNIGLWRSAVLSQVPLLAEDLEHGAGSFPVGRLDADLQQIDHRSFNSWRMTLTDVPTAELLEVHLVNAVAPFVLNARLKPLLARAGTGDAHVVNVSAMEGQFYRRWKTDRHPHTNMAKAALNMMTRTSAIDYVRDGIHMNSVDTGWVTDEDPLVLAARKVAMHAFCPPLDIVDGAARIVDPLFDGISTGNHVWGLFLKDYRPAPW